MSKENMNLYEISTEINEIASMVDDNGVLLPEAEAMFDKLIMTKTDKFRNMGGMIKNLDSYIEAVKVEKARLSLKQKSAENLIERLKSYLKMSMIKNNDLKFQAWTFSFSFRKSNSIEVSVDASKLPKIYQRITIEANKPELKKALEAGKKIKGVSVAPGQNLVIS